MSSILTNTSALSALRSLATTQKALTTTQNQISSGLKIATAADGIGNWSMAAQIKSDNGALGAVSDGLNVTSSMIDTFATATDQIISATNSIKTSLVAAQQSGADLTKIQADIAAQQTLIKNIASSASVNGDNWLQGDSTASSTKPGSLSNSASRQILIGYSNAAGASTMSVNTAGTTLVDSNTTTTAGTNKGVLSVAGTASGKSLLNLDVTNLPAGKTIANLLTDVDTAIKGVTTVGATLGGTKTAIDTQQMVISSMQDSMTRTVSALVDADMNEASTRLQALQTQQSLAVQALAIANQNSAAILALFRN